MDPAIMNKLQEMEEEMSRFEQEIAVPQSTYDGPASSSTGGHSLHFLPHQVQRAHHAASRASANDSASGMYIQHPVDYSQAVISAPPQPSVIKAAPAVYAALPVRTVSKVEEVITIPSLPKPEPKPTVTPVQAPYIPPYIRQLGPAVTSSVAAAHEESTNKTKPRKKKMVRAAGGQHWEDNSLLEWDPDDFRIFCGDLGNDVTDEVLTRAFGKFPSFTKARVVRDKRNNKTKGYGFVSFKDPQDFIKAMKEMNGKYVGSRPIKLRKSTWKDRNIETVRKRNKEKQRLGLR
ncbi:hypothetical protein CHUAL_000470 [Chamberlinius hualienensis]